MILEAAIHATERHRSARDDATTYVDATPLVNEVRRDLRRLRRGVRVNILLTLIVLVWNVILPAGVILLR
jgi:hypothetical protein